MLDEKEVQPLRSQEEEKETHDKISQVGRFFNTMSAEERRHQIVNGVMISPIKNEGILTQLKREGASEVEIQCHSFPKKEIYCKLTHILKLSKQLCEYPFCNKTLIHINQQILREIGLFSSLYKNIVIAEEEKFEGESHGQV